MTLEKIEPSNKKRGWWKQWWEKFAWNVPTDKDIAEEKIIAAQASSIVSSIMNGHLKITREFVPGILPFGGGRYMETYHYKSDYLPSEWDKIEHHQL